MNVAELLDGATPEPVLVIGSPPPAGNDLDLLVRPAAATALASVLADNGFHHGGGHVWVRFASCSAEIVELIPSSSLGLASGQIERLYAEAGPLEGFASLMLPSAHHRLLLTARLVSREARLGDKRRNQATATDEDAWRLAREHAPGWQAERALTELERALSDAPPRSWRLRSTIARLDRYRHGAVIAISGLDGSGKSTQVEGLIGTLGKLGYPAVGLWTSLTAHPLLSTLAAPARALLGTRRHPTGVEQRPPAGEDDDRLTRLRERLPWLGLAWVTFVATVNACWQASAVRRHSLRGRIVICDRYTLDSLVHLRYRYGAHRRYRAQLALIRFLSPQPLRAYLLDVSPETAGARNREYTPAQIELRARLYREEHAPLGVELLDGERSREDICAQIGLDVWSALRVQRDHARPALARALMSAYIRLRGRR